MRRPTRSGLQWTGEADPTLSATRSEALDDQPPITHATDPRWVLAIRVAQQLQGQILVPERREKLMRLGKQLGLSPFAVHLIIAIVQDQARRGYAPDDCPRSGEPQLRMVPLTAPGSHSSHRRGWRLAWLISGMILLELLVVNWLLT